MCCDELAVAVTGKRVVYATALEQAARKRLEPARSLLDVAFGVRKMTLLNRVQNVLGVDPSYGRIRWPLTAALLLVAILVIWLVATSPWHGKYTASAFLKVDMQEKSVLHGEAANLTDRDRFEIYKSSQREWLLSRFVLMAALAGTRKLPGHP